MRCKMYKKSSAVPHTHAHNPQGINPALTKQVVHRSAGKAPQCAGLLLADAADLEQLPSRGRPLAAHAAQCGIRADDVRGDLVIFGELPAQVAQFLEQLGVIAHARAGIQRCLLTHQIDGAPRRPGA